jgi:hypothetical protein
MNILTDTITFDTCANPAANDACSLIEQWDDDLHDDQVIYTLVQVNKRCSLHGDLVDASIISTLYEENTRKNKAWNKAAELTGLTNSQVAWSYDPGRTLHISFPGNSVSQNVKTSIQNWCNTNLGLGLVVVA